MPRCAASAKAIAIVPKDHLNGVELHASIELSIQHRPLKGGNDILGFALLFFALLCFAVLCSALLCSAFDIKPQPYCLPQNYRPESAGFRLQVQTRFVLGLVVQLFC